MKKTLDYLYIFAKFSTSLILLLALIILGYFFYVGFKNQEVSNNSQAEFINKLNQNAQKLSELTKQIKNTDASLDEIKQSIQNNSNIDNSKDISLLNKKIEQIDLSLEDISTNLQKIQTTNVYKSNKNQTDNLSSFNGDENKAKIINLAIYKFENNLDFTEELNLLQNFSNNKEYIFEKINLIRLKNFRGNSYLKKTYSQELDFYLKQKFNKSYNNFLSKSIMRFVAIEPSKTNTIKNNEIHTLNEISNLLDKKNYKISYEKIIYINNYENYFSETIKQIQIAKEFKELIIRLK